MERTICCEFVETLLYKLKQLRGEGKLFQKTKEAYRDNYPLTPFSFSLIKAIENHVSLPPFGCIGTFEKVCSFICHVEYVLKICRDTE